VLILPNPGEGLHGRATPDFPNGRRAIAETSRGRSITCIDKSLRTNDQTSVCISAIWPSPARRLGEMAFRCLCRLFRPVLPHDSTSRLIEPHGTCCRLPCELSGSNCSISRSEPPWKVAVRNDDPVTGPSALSSSYLSQKPHRVIGHDLYRYGLDTACDISII
jgi:hypothetical protein